VTKIVDVMTHIAPKSRAGRGAIASYVRLPERIGALVEGARAGLVVSVLLAAAGLAAGAVHAAFLAAGHPEFRAPASLGVLAATVLVSAIQAPLALRALRSAAARARGTLR